MNESDIGAICGIVQSIIGHPLDTIKVWTQNKEKISFNIRKLYLGVSFPTINSALSGYLLFGSNDYFYKIFNNYYIAGFLSGLMITPQMQIAEYYKINEQMQSKKSMLKLLPYSNTGMLSTFIREGIGSGVYFVHYHYFNDNIGLHPFLAGGIGGMTSWLFAYPIDVIKSRVQVYPHEITYYIAYKMGNLWNGISVTMIRGFLVNGSIFYVYDYLKKMN